jgi:hypothetical protein
MPRVANKPGSYVKRADLSKVGTSKAAVRKAEPLNDLERQQLAQRLSESVGRGAVIDTRPSKSK